jgi:methylenetetrahydrofolate dehydrogenase (NADP+) / methenyltetrahydrofolate cyclohydrolase
MQTILLDGKLTAARVIELVRVDAENFYRQTGRKPGLVVIHAGNDPASALYIRNKQKACLSSGIVFNQEALPETVSSSDILRVIETYNHNETCDGLIVQLPLPSSALDENEVLNKISVLKDVDGFHPVSVGRLWSGTGDIAPCTPAGIMRLLHEYAVPVQGKQVVIIGRSNIVGKPLAALFLREHATVTIAHSRTRDLALVSRTADILVAAAGKPGLVSADHIKDGAVVIDVGINRITREQALPHWLIPESPIGRKIAQKGFALVGDVDLDGITGRVSHYTPVPGGVGPMTVAMLLVNTMTLAQNRLKGFAS